MDIREYNPAEVVRTQWPLVQKAFQALIELSDNDPQKCIETVMQRAEASDINRLQRKLQARLDHDRYEFDKLSRNDKFDAGLLRITANMITVAQGNQAMNNDLPPPARQDRGTTYVEEFPKGFIRSLIRMDRIATALGVSYLDNPISRLPNPAFPR